MSYIIKNKIKNALYVSFVKKISFMGKTHTIKKHIGKEPAEVSKEKYILDNLNVISEEEFEFREKFLKNIKNNLSHNINLPDKVELKSIKIDNLIESKNCKQIFDTEFAKEFIFNSNNIEGSKIPPEKVREIIDTGNTKYKDKNEIREVKNSIQAFEYLQESFKFNIRSIKRLYHILTNKLVMENRAHYPRGFKKIANVVGNSPTTSPENVLEELNSLLSWYKNNRKKIHPLILAFEFHRKYESIHPFLDGNGRTGRLIMNKILISAGYSPIIIYKENKTSYFNALEKTRDEKHKNYYQFMLEQADKTYDFLLKVINKY